MKPIRTLTLKNAPEWRAWLSEHHATESEIWLVFFKKHTGIAGIDYGASVEEALCFGWVDSLVRRLDDDRYARKFTPRTDTKKWSVSNRHRVAKLIREGRMTPAGLAKVGYPHPERVAHEAPQRRRPQDPPTPDFIAAAIRTNDRAWKNFKAMAPSYRRNYIGWVTSAKRESTRVRRLQEVIRLLEKNEKLGLK